MSERAKLSDIMRFAMPSEEELTEGAERRMAMVRPVLIDNWPEEVRALSMKTTLVPFDKALAVNLFDRKGGELPDGVVELAAEIDAICGFDHHFFRLNSRSPKDAPFPLELPVSCSGKEMLNVISCSERCLDDIATFSRTADPLYICLREFIPGLRPDEELRCFVKDGELMAVAQYGLGEFDAPAGLREHVEEYWRDTLKPRMHIDTFVFDLWIGYAGPLLIELNPYGLSDPVGAGSYDRIEQGILGIAIREPRP